MREKVAIGGTHAMERNRCQTATEGCGDYAHSGSRRACRGVRTLLLSRFGESAPL